MKRAANIKADQKFNLYIREGVGPQRTDSPILRRLNQTHILNYGNNPITNRIDRNQTKYIIVGQHSLCAYC
jgi:hypothetical protein